MRRFLAKKCVKSALLDLFSIVNSTASGAEGCGFEPRRTHKLGVTAPAVVTREMVLGHMPWRKKHGGERNTALLEMKFFDQVLEEAVNRGFIRTNCAIAPRHV